MWNLDSKRDRASRGDIERFLHGRKSARDGYLSRESSVVVGVQRTILDLPIERKLCMD